VTTAAIRIQNLSKQYQMGAREKTYDTFREAVTSIFTSPLQRLQRLSGRAGDNEIFWALKDVSFDVQPGEVVGIIGRNGAGKSTLLKILSQITEPTSGRIEINGRVASLLEVGTGFHPELTGRENIFLNGAILGMSRAEIKRKFDEIVDFAGVEKFLDTPVKRYSSGMTVRLAFAVAAHLDPEILIIDEVLAVGDAEFQKKCLGKMHDVALGGRTVLFVSHNLSAVRTLCSVAVVLNEGQVIFKGDVDRGLSHYSKGGQDCGDHWTRPPNREKSHLMFVEVASDLSGEQPNIVLNVEMTLAQCESYAPAFVAIDILDSSGATIMQALPRTKGFLNPNGSGHRIRIPVKLPPLIPGIYSVSPWVGPAHSETYDFIESAVSFLVEESPTLNRTFPHASDHGAIVPWSEIAEHFAI